MPDAQNDENNEDKSDEEASAASPDDKADERSAPPNRAPSDVTRIALGALRAMLGPPPDSSGEEPGDNEPGDNEPGEDQPGEDPNPQP